MMKANTKRSLLLLFILLFVQTAYARPITLSVVTYNLQFLPFMSGTKERAKAIPEQLAPLADVFVFQEGFDSEPRKALKKHMHLNGVPYNSETLERSFLSGFRFAGSGLFVMSKYPIVEEDGIFFQDSFTDVNGVKLPGLESYHSDRLADKGVLHVKIVKDGKAFHVFTTHLQAKSHDDDGKPLGIQIRAKQLGRIYDFIASKRIPASEPIIIAGDMNVARQTRPDEYASMVDRLNAIEVPLEGFAYTTLHRPLYEEAEGEEVGERGVQIDYIMAFRRNLLPLSANAMVLENIRLSDHFPVIAVLNYDANT